MGHRLGNSTMSATLHKLARQDKRSSGNLAAKVFSNLADISDPVIRGSMDGDCQMEHRLETVCFINGVEYINDSKATNVNATWFALENMSKQTILIVGGVDKGYDYSPIYEAGKRIVKTAIFLGLNTERMKKELKYVADNLFSCKSMREAVHAAYCHARKGEAVLLSPGCASFDLFDNYEDRGFQFKKYVHLL